MGCCCLAVHTARCEDACALAASAQYIKFLSGELGGSSLSSNGSKGAANPFYYAAAAAAGAGMAPLANGNGTAALNGGGPAAMGASIATHATSVRDLAAPDSQLSFDDPIVEQPK